MNKKVIKSYDKFVNEGRREQAKIDEILDIMSKRKLTKEEQDLLARLSKGESLPPEQVNTPNLKTHKTGGGYVFDDEGNVLTEEEPDTPGQEFLTTKGKQRSADKLTKDDVIDARVYRNKNSEERWIFANISVNEEGGMKNDWLIYRTGSMSGKFPMGQFMDTNSPKYIAFKNKTADLFWKELDFEFDFGMVLDQDLYEDFINFVELYKEYKKNPKRNVDILNRLRRRFLGLL